MNDTNVVQSEKAEKKVMKRRPARTERERELAAMMAEDIRILNRVSSWYLKARARLVMRMLKIYTYEYGLDQEDAIKLMGVTKIYPPLGL